MLDTIAALLIAYLAGALLTAMIAFAIVDGKRD